MKKIYLLLLILICISCESTCEISYTVLDTENQFPYFEFKNERHKSSSESVIEEDRYTKIDIEQAIIKEILSNVRSQIHQQERATPKMKEEICDYGIQIVGANDHVTKQNVYFLYFIYGATFNDQEPREFWKINDGGDNIFSGFYQEKNKKFKIITINGSA